MQSTFQLCIVEGKFLVNQLTKITLQIKYTVAIMHILQNKKKYVKNLHITK